MTGGHGFYVYATVLCSPGLRRRSGVWGCGSVRGGGGIMITFDNNLSASFAIVCLTGRGKCRMCTTYTGANNFDPRRLGAGRRGTCGLNTGRCIAVSIARRCCRGDLECVMFKGMLHGNACPVSMDSRHVFRTLTVTHCTGRVNTSTVTRNSANTNGSRVHFSVAFLIVTPNIRVVALAHSVTLDHRRRVSCLGRRNFTTSFAGLGCSCGINL